MKEKKVVEEISENMSSNENQTYLNTEVNLLDKYDTALIFFKEKEYQDALNIFYEIENDFDVKEWINKCKEKLNKINQKRIKKEEKIRRREKNAEIFQEVVSFVFIKMIPKILCVLLCLIPLGLVVTFGVLLFSNFRYIAFYSSAGWLTFAWICLIIITIFFYLSLIALLADKSRIPGLFIIIMVVIYFIPSIFVFPNVSKIEKNFSPASVLSIKVNGKSNNGYSGSRYYFDMYFVLENISSKTINYIDGKYEIYSGNTFLSSGNLWFDGELTPGEVENITVNFTESGSSTYDASFDSLKIVYDITEIKVETKVKGKKTCRFKNSPMVIKENNYNSYWEDEDISSEHVTSSVPQSISNDTLEGRIYNFVGAKVTLPDNYLIAEDERIKEGISIYDYSYPQAYLVDFVVPKELKDTFYSDYVNKLLANGYSYRAEGSGYTEYIKNGVVVSFANVIQSNFNSEGDYVEDYYVMYFLTFKA